MPKPFLNFLLNSHFLSQPIWWRDCGVTKALFFVLLPHANGTCGLGAVCWLLVSFVNLVLSLVYGSSIAKGILFNAGQTFNYAKICFLITIRSEAKEFKLERTGTLSIPPTAQAPCSGDISGDKF